MESRYWICHSLDPNFHEMPYGDETVAVVDEKGGGIILYCHEKNADFILKALRVTEES